MQKFFPLAVFLIAAISILGCEDDVFLCNGGECNSQRDCFDECSENICLDGAFNLAGYECVFVEPGVEPGECFCECFIGCFE